MSINRKIIITGTTCTGKTTLGKKLSNKTNIPRVDLDDVHFLPNWVEKDPIVFVKDVTTELTKYQEWIVSGSYQSLLKDTVWQEANLIVWLDYPLHLILRRYVIRTFKRVVFKQKCCGENYETLSRTFSKDSLFFWIFKSYWHKKRRLESWSTGLFAHKEWMVFTGVDQEEKIFKRLASKTNPQ